MPVKRRVMPVKRRVMPVKHCATRSSCGRSLSAGILVTAVLAACTAVGPNFSPPHEAVPDQYAGAVADAARAPPPDTAGQGASAPRPTSAADPEVFWWQQFHDADLNRLQSQAAAGNLDLRAAFFRIVESRLQAQVARAQGLPGLNGTASFTREQLGAAGILKSEGFTPDSTASTSTQHLISGIEAPVNIYELGFDASWELDLFGKVRRSVEAADAQSAGAVESRNDLLVSLEAEVAESYLQMRAAQSLKQLTIELIAAQRDVFELTSNRHAHGLAGEVDVEAARAQLSSLSSQLPSYEQTIATSKHALAVLTGQAPEALDAQFGTTGELPAPPAVVPVGLPSTLARRRPDIRGSEAALHAATAQIGVAVASLFPDISLTGSYGLRNLGTRYLFDWSSNFYTFGPSISIPIFHGGALVSSVRLSRAQAAEAAANYRKTVLSALQEVEDGLSSLNEDALRNAALRETVTADQRAYDVDMNAYRHGLISYIDVLTLQLQTVQARQQLAQALLTQSTDVVKLYKALGGGWESAPMSAAQ
jgi:NodT family efflux transporter outer membrane factor (OMF) lipoprotein